MMIRTRIERIKRDKRCLVPHTNISEIKLTDVEINMARLRERQK